MQTHYSHKQTNTAIVSLLFLFIPSLQWFQSSPLAKTYVYNADEEREIDGWTVILPKDANKTRQLPCLHWQHKTLSQGHCRVTNGTGPRLHPPSYKSNTVQQSVSSLCWQAGHSVTAVLMSEEGSYQPQSHKPKLHSMKAVPLYWGWSTAKVLENSKQVLPRPPTECEWSRTRINSTYIFSISFILSWHFRNITTFHQPLLWCLVGYYPHS